MGVKAEELEVVDVPEPVGPGNALVLEVQSAEVNEVFTDFGHRGLPAEEVAARCADAAREYEAADVPVGRHLADQLLLPLALAGGGAFRTLEPTLHTRTNAEVIRRFLKVKIGMVEVALHPFPSAA